MDGVPPRPPSPPRLLARWSHQRLRRRPLRRGGRRLKGGGRRPSVYYRLDGVDAWRPPGVPARDGLVLLLMMYSSSRLV